MKLGDVIRVDWVDAHTVHGWMDQHEMNRSISDPCATVVSAGLFVAETETAIIITRGISEYGSYEGSLEIPKSTIKDIKFLEENNIDVIQTV
jgi:hypothetical protein